VVEVAMSDIWHEYVDSLTWSKGHLDDSSWCALLRAGSLKVPAEQAIREIAQRIELAGDHPKAGKLQRQVKRAYEHAGSSPGQVYVPRIRKPVYEPVKLKRIASKVDFDITAKWMSKVSPLSVRGRSPAGFLHQLFKPGECVLVFSVFESQGEVWKHTGGKANLSVNHLQKGYQNVWFASNPMDGQYHWNPREQKESRRSEESVIGWRYAILESDDAPKDLWLKAVVQLPVPIASIYDSGGSSIHVMILINADSKSEWDRIVRGDLAQLMIPLGADLGAMTAIRLTRLPNCRREQTGRLQQLLYLDPNPDYTPIAMRSTHKGVSNV
jgi:hypothetical protein